MNRIRREIPNGVKSIENSAVIHHNTLKNTSLTVYQCQPSKNVMLLSTQKFRTEWDSEDVSKDRIVQIPTDETNVYCEYCNTTIRTKIFHIEDHAKMIYETNISDFILTVYWSSSPLSDKSRTAFHLPPCCRFKLNPRPLVMDAISVNNSVTNFKHKVHVSTVLLRSRFPK
ncbi:unnamed protein product [Lepeophtheirus salmonis]|uniref:(salmon louse) hypothetical protein n=1 Tax=Lepeophtheirus salmonis TaxID=72036 RepID=A0A7R8CLX8_LEPSM|nr:unnamed protein product [Lepeophtheirus salmonis]CAF2861739.1 unnamed protein product [Lepeophtheirus salmonis]